MGNIKASKTIKSKHRLLCMTVNHLGAKEEKLKIGKKAIMKKKLKLKRKNKKSKDERKILKRQKTTA